MAGPEQEELEAALSMRIDAIFERCAQLCGFSVDERLVRKGGKKGAREWELYVSAVAAYPELGPVQADGFIGEISEALAELCKQRPKAADLLPGRTFAR